MKFLANPRAFPVVTLIVRLIFSDPYAWTVTEVQKWAAWTLEQYKLPANHLNEFMIDGTSLCMLHEGEFKKRSPQVGEYLFAQLEFWRNGENLSEE